ncbi:MAG: alpha/beta fold hydrolase [Casimicrobium sp.]
MSPFITRAGARARIFQWIFFVLCVAVIGAASSVHAKVDDLPRKTQLGIGIAPLSAEERKTLNLESAHPSALKVTAVSPIFTAAKAGIKTGDVLLSINGEGLRPAPEMQLWVSQQKPGSKASFALLRDGKPILLETHWIERPREPDNDQYRVRYESIVSRNARMRTVVTIPASLKAGEKAPALLFIPGVALGTLDVSLTNPDAYSQIVRAFATRGYVTMRVDKPGIGDSEDGPAVKSDFLREADIYVQGLKALAARNDVDRNRIVVFGHSMGGLWAPLAVEQTPVKAVIVGGTVFRSWYEYVIENTRRQSALAGTPPAELDDEMRKVAFVQQRYLNEKLTPEQILALDPNLKTLIDEDFKPAGQHMGRVHAFWQQVAAMNLPAAWERALAKNDTKLLVFWGASEFVAAEVDHPMLVDFINSKRPNSAKYVRLPNSDHGFNDVATMSESQAKWGKPGTKFNPNINDAIHDWLRDISL